MIEENVLEVAMKALAENPDRVNNVTIVYRISLLNQLGKLSEEAFGEFHMRRITGNAELVSPQVDPHIQLFFDDFEMAVALTRKLLH